MDLHHSVCGAKPFVLPVTRSVHISQLPAENKLNFEYRQHEA